MSPRVEDKELRQVMRWATCAGRPRGGSGLSPPLGWEGGLSSRQPRLVPRCCHLHDRSDWGGLKHPGPSALAPAVLVGVAQKPSVGRHSSDGVLKTPGSQAGSILCTSGMHVHSGQRGDEGGRGMGLWRPGTGNGFGILRGVRVFRTCSQETITRFVVKKTKRNETKAAAAGRGRHPGQPRTAQGMGSPSRAQRTDGRPPTSSLSTRGRCKN